MSRFTRSGPATLLWLLAACSAKVPTEPVSPAEKSALKHHPEKSAEEKADKEAHQDEESAHEPLPSRVRLQPSVLAAARIRSETVVAKVLPQTLELPGEVAADPDHSVRIAARVPGRISAVFFKEGLPVKAGDLLAVIESAELLRTASTYVSASARVQAAQQNAARLQSLMSTGLAANQELLDAQAQARALDAEAQAARRSLLSFGLHETQLTTAQSRFELRAPIAGYPLSRNATVGQTVPAEHILCDLIDLNRAYFIGRLYERNLARVRAGQPVEVHLNAYPDTVFVGTVETIGKQLDVNTRTVVTRIAITNREELLKVGLFGKAQVSLSEGGSTRGLVVPFAAVTRIAERDVVFVRQADEHFEVHPVTLGASAAGEVQVLTGLRAGEQVVTEGVFTLKGVLLKRTFAEEE